MSYAIKDLTLDVYKESRVKPIVAKQYDVNSRFLRVQLTSDGEPIAIESEDYVVINAQRSDGQEKSFRGTVDEDGRALVPITHWIQEINNYVVCSISVIDGKMRRKLTSSSFEIIPESAEVTNQYLPEDDSYDILVSLISDCNNIKSDMVTITAEAIEAAENAEKVTTELTSLMSGIEQKLSEKMPNYTIGDGLAVTDDTIHVTLDSDVLIATGEEITEMLSEVFAG